MSKGMEVCFYDQGARKASRYVSGTLVYEEALHHGRWIGLYWSASGQVQRENLAASLPKEDTIVLPYHAFDLEIDGQDLRNGWEMVSTSQREGARPNTIEAVVELRHTLRPLTVKVITRLDGTPFLCRYLAITNTGGRPAALSRVSPWSGLLWTWNQGEHWGEMAPAQEGNFSLGWFNGLCQGSEGNFQWEKLPVGWRRVESTFGQSGFGNPFFVVRNQANGETAMMSLAWSGNWYAEFWNDPFRDLANQPARGLNLAFRMGPHAPGPQRVIEPGETIQTPETHLGLLHGGEDEMVGAWHGHLRASVIPQAPRGKEVFSVAGRVVEQPGTWIHREIEIAAEMGVQSFMVDAGWYGDDFAGWPENRGDWQVGSWLPGGLKTCRDLCHKKGLLFGLWMEPETVGVKSKLNREHPEWMLRTDDNREIRKVLDLSHPQAAAFFRQEVVRVIKEHQLDFFKIDYNERVEEGGQRQRLGFRESEGWRHYETLYSVFDQVRREMPQVALECCASGGGRDDLGMMSRFHYACESDFSMFPRSIRAINGLTRFLPPEALCYYHNHMPVAHQKTDLDTHLRVTLFAKPVFVGFGGQDADRSTAYFEKTRRYIQMGKKFCWPIMAAKPVVYHHTPDIGLYSPAEWCVLEYTMPDKKAGYAGVFKVGSGADEYLLRLRGVELGATYEVAMDNQQEKFRTSGKELAMTGLAIRLESPMTSQLVMYNRVGG